MLVVGECIPILFRFLALEFVITEIDCPTNSFVALIFVKPASLMDVWFVLLMLWIHLMRYLARLRLTLDGPLRSFVLDNEPKGLRLQLSSQCYPK